MSDVSQKCRYKIFKTLNYFMFFSIVQSTLPISWSPIFPTRKYTYSVFSNIFIKSTKLYCIYRYSGTDFLNIASISADKFTSLIERGVNSKGCFSYFSGSKGKTDFIVYFIFVSIKSYKAWLSWFFVPLWRSNSSLTFFTISCFKTFRSFSSTEPIFIELSFFWVITEFFKGESFSLSSTVFSMLPGKEGIFFFTEGESFLN